MDRTPFHPDELAAQARAGLSPGGAGIRDFMPEQHRSFFGQLPHIFVACVDAAGWPLATLLEGEPGFVSTPDPTTLAVRALPGAADPAAGTLHAGQQIGVLGIDLATRRRNRANGVLSHVDATGFAVSVTQSFGNCPQYIQRRALRREEPARGPAEELVLPQGGARTLIERADTFFVATRSRAQAGPAGGADISHRGGWPGFVRLEQDTLLIPDFRGNRYFNTLGNIQGEPRASLLFLDFESGSVLQLQGLASIDWSAPSAGAPAGAERVWRFRIVRGWYRSHAAAMRGTFVDYSPVTLRTGTWSTDLEERHVSTGAPLA
jgi:predicted pyridoxine 5'-phosphate oxidase superfamily flavin-nucleotide-binding protein